MIVKFFTRGTGGSGGVFNYLLKDKEQEDGLRLDAEVLRGDIDNQSMLIDSLDFKQKYTSGCLSFTESADQVTQAQKEQLMDSFEETIRAGLDVDRVSVSWIEHRDKGRLELNFVYANVDLEHGRAFQPYVHSVDKRRVNAWKDMQNIEYGFSDPNDPANKRLMGQRDNLPRDVKEARQGITDALTALVAEGVITSRTDVVQSLTDAGFEIARQTDKAISIKNPDPESKRNIRLTGGLYERDFNFSREVQNTVKAASNEYRARATERYNAAKQLYDSEIVRKRDYHQGRHGQPTAKQRAVTADASRASNRYKYSPYNLFEQRPSPFNPRFKRAKESDRDADRGLRSPNRPADTRPRGQDSAGHQIRNEKVGDSHQFVHPFDTGTRHDDWRSASQQVLETDLYSAANQLRTTQLRAEVTHGQATARSSAESPTIATGHDQTSRADARRSSAIHTAAATQERPRYSGINSIIDQIGADANTRDSALADAIQYIEGVNGKVHQRMGYLEKSSERARTDTGKYHRAITRLGQHTESTSRDVERVSEYDNTARLSKERYEAIRQQIEHLSERTEQNRSVTSENNRLAERNTGGIDGIKQIADQAREVITANVQAKNLANTRSRSPRMGR